VIPAGEDFAEQALINVRIRNSLPKTANTAAELAKAQQNTAARIQVQLKAYDDAKPGTHEHPGPASDGGGL
jgi:hypothetical protein